MINFISKSLEFFQLLFCKIFAGLFLCKRNEKNCKSTLTPNIPFAARFSCCATINFNPILNNNDILLRTHGPYHRHKNTKSG